MNHKVVSLDLRVALSARSHVFYPNQKEKQCWLGTSLSLTELPEIRHSTSQILRTGLWRRIGTNSSPSFPGVIFQSTDRVPCAF